MVFVLETPRLRLLPWSAGPEDIDALRSIASDPEVMRYINNSQPWPEERLREFVERQIRQYSTLGYCYWKLVLKETENNVLSGFCGIQPLAETGEPEIGWWLARSCWGIGLATEAAQEALRDAFERVGVEHVVSVAHPQNRASIHVMERLGMSYEKEMLHRGVNHVFYAIRKEAWLAIRPH